MDVKYSLFTDTNFGFEIKYPNGLGEIQKGPGSLWIQTGKSILTNKKDCLFEAQCFLNQERHSWATEYEKYLTPFHFDKTHQITYKTFKPNYFVVSGIFDKKIFYHKEIAYQKDGRWLALIFNIVFFQTQKKNWDPVLIECANSLKLIQVHGESHVSVGWPVVKVDASKEKLLGLSQKWIDSNLQCVQYPQENDATEKLSLEKCVIDEFNNSFFQLSDQSPIQFVLSARGSNIPHTGNFGYVGCDQKFVLFSFKNGELSGKVIFKTSLADPQNPSGKDSCTNYGDAIDFVDFPNGSKGLLLNVNDGGAQTIGHLFMEIKGILKEVLVFKKAYIYSGPYLEPCSEGVLVPADTNNLNLMIRNWVPNEGEPTKPNVYHYSVIHYRFDPTIEKYLQLGDEEKLPDSQDFSLWPYKIFDRPILPVY